MGEVTVALFAGVETQTEPAGVVPGVIGGMGAGAGKGAIPEVGPVASVSVTGGHDAAPGPGAGAGPGAPGPGFIPVTDVIELEPPHPEEASTPARSVAETITWMINTCGRSNKRFIGDEPQEEWFQGEMRGR